MGLILDGTWKDKFYDDAQMSGKQVAELFEVAVELFDKKERLGKNVQFELHSSKRKTIRGQKRMIKQFSLPSTFTKTKGGDTITITYFDKKIMKKDKDTGKPYPMLTPRKVTSDRMVASYDVDKYMDKIVYFSLHHQCHTSPLADSDGEKMYGLKLHGKEAKVYLDSKREQSYLYNKIFSDPVMILRLRAKGLGINNVDNMQDESVRKVLSEKLDAAIAGVNGQNFKKFESDFNAPYSGIRGQVQECLDKGYFVKKQVGERTVYYWKPKMEMTGEICKVPRHKHPVDFLVDHMVSNWDTYHTYIKNAIRYGDRTNENTVNEFEDEMRQQSAKKKKVSQMSIGDVVQEAVRLSAIVYNVVDKGVYLYDPKSKNGLASDPFMVAELATWSAEVEAELSNKPELLKKISQKINGKRLGASAKK